jgi:hypothetical protein
MMDFDDLFEDMDMTPDEKMRAFERLRQDIVFESMAQITSDVQQLFIKSMKAAQATARLTSDPEVYEAFNDMVGAIMESLTNMIIIHDQNRN